MMSHSRNRRKIMDKKLSFLLFIDECFLKCRICDKDKIRLYEMIKNTKKDKARLYFS